MKAIEKLVGLPEQSNVRGLTLRKFLVAMLYVLTYAPDRESTGSFKNLREEFEKHFGYSANLEDALERNFYSHLYIDRIERAEIESLISAMRPVLVRGLPGVGKTVVVKKNQGEL